MDAIDRILALMSANGVTAAQLTREISLTNGLITQWKSRKQKPSTEAIIKLAQYFHVSTDYLLLGKESEQSIVPALSKDDLELLELYHQLSERDQGQCVGFIKGLIKREPVEDTVPKKKVAER